MESALAARDQGVTDDVLASLPDQLPADDCPELAGYLITRSIQHRARRGGDARGSGHSRRRRRSTEHVAGDRAASALGRRTLHRADRRGLAAVLDRIGRSPSREGTNQ
ncbi:hypothetical protein [Kutzneria sp. NPDC051319]|uniref:hypothetical protein n=1 Tax=Kutzneria sp. NPDC051319 TaxID=3155047 RepID=UPI00343ABBF4